MKSFRKRSKNKSLHMCMYTKSTILPANRVEKHICLDVETFCDFEPAGQRSGLDSFPEGSRDTFYQRNETCRRFTALYGKSEAEEMPVVRRVRKQSAYDVSIAEVSMEIPRNFYPISSTLARHIHLCIASIRGQSFTVMQCHRSFVQHWLTCRDFNGRNGGIPPRNKKRMNRSNDAGNCPEVMHSGFYLNFSLWLDYRNFGRSSTSKYFH